MDVFKSPTINKVQFKNLVGGGAANVMEIKQMLTYTTSKL